jgi:hypothetical protein
MMGIPSGAQRTVRTAKYYMKTFRLSIVSYGVSIRERAWNIMGLQNRDDIMAAIDMISAEINKRSRIKTLLGPADPKDGYNIVELRFRRNVAFACVCFLSRAIRERDIDEKGEPIYRGCDNVTFVYSKKEGFVLTDDEYEDLARRHEYLRSVADRAVDIVEKRFSDGPTEMYGVALALTVHMTADSVGLTKEEQPEVYEIALGFLNENIKTAQGTTGE